MGLVAPLSAVRLISAASHFDGLPVRAMNCYSERWIKQPAFSMSRHLALNVSSVSNLNSIHFDLLILLTSAWAIGHCTLLVDLLKWPMEGVNWVFYLVHSLFSSQSSRCIRQWWCHWCYGCKYFYVPVLEAAWIKGLHCVTAYWPVTVHASIIDDWMQSCSKTSSSVYSDNSMVV